MMQRAIPVAERRGSLPVFRSTAPAQPAAPRADAPLVLADLIGAGRKLEEADIAEAARLLGCDAAAIRAVLDVEAAGSGFRKSGVPTIRFEPHVFSRETARAHDGKRFSVADFGEAQRVANRSDAEKLLIEAAAVDRAAALRSTSWGLGQIMGFNHALAGCDTVEQLVREAAESEGQQLRHMMSFIQSSKLAGHLRAHDWARFARGYNGPAYRTHDYDGKLARAYARHAGGPAWIVLELGATGPAVKRLQAALNRLDFGVSDDGHFGPETEQAVRAFQQSNSLSVDGVVGARTWSALEAAAAVEKAKDVAPPPPAPEQDVTDKILETVRDVGAAGGAVGAPVSSGPLQYVFIGLIGVAAIALVFQLVRSRFKK